MFFVYLCRGAARARVDKTCGVGAARCDDHCHERGRRLPTRCGSVAWAAFTICAQVYDTRNSCIQTDPICGHFLAWSMSMCAWTSGYERARTVVFELNLDIVSSFVVIGWTLLRKRITAISAFTVHYMLCSICILYLCIEAWVSPCLTSSDMWVVICEKLNIVQRISSANSGGITLYFPVIMAHLLTFFSLDLHAFSRRPVTAGHKSQMHIYKGKNLFVWVHNRQANLNLGDLTYRVVQKFVVLKATFKGIWSFSNVP